MSERIHELKGRAEALPKDWHDWTPLMLDNVLADYQSYMRRLLAVADAAAIALKNSHISALNGDLTIATDKAYALVLAVAALDSEVSK